MIDLLLAQSILQPLAIFVAGMVLYSVFVFYFYKFLSQKTIFQLDLHQYNITNHRLLKSTISIFLYGLKYIIIFPFIVAFWSTVLAMLLLFLSQNREFSTILLISVAVVSAIRICAYIDEALSVDLAKMLPFALLGVFLVDASILNFSETWQTLATASLDNIVIIHYLGFVVLLEFVLKLIDSIKEKLHNMHRKYPDIEEAFPEKN